MHLKLIHAVGINDFLGNDFLYAYAGYLEGDAIVSIKYIYSIILLL